jgi:hypothetical protein
MRERVHSKTYLKPFLLHNATIICISFNVALILLSSNNCPNDGTKECTKSWSSANEMKLNT